MSLMRIDAVRAAAATLAVVAVAAVGACTPSSGGGQTTTTKGSTITIKSYKYTVPATVHPKQKITVHNEDSVAHTVTSKPGGMFNSKVGADATSSFTAPAKAGKYSFICTYHPYMKATLVVK